MVRAPRRERDVDRDRAAGDRALRGSLGRVVDDLAVARRARRPAAVAGDRVVRVAAADEEGRRRTELRLGADIEDAVRLLTEGAERLRLEAGQPDGVRLP